MAITNTTYLGLNKPDYDAVADIEVLNQNSDIIDAKFDGTHLVEKVNGVSPTGGAVTIDLGVTSVNNMTGDVTITERSVLDLINIFYPVGTYYETTNANFDPNVAWAGSTWQRVADGRALIAGGGSSGYTVGNVYGEKTHKITVSEMPIHKHSASSATNGAHAHTATTDSAGAHTHERGTLNITGSIVNGSSDTERLTYADDITSRGALSVTNRAATNGFSEGSGEGVAYNGIAFNAANGWSGSLASNGAHTHDVTVKSNGDHSHIITVGNTGNGTAMSLVQPSIAVARWLRTA